jgi:multisubunit Na+/H+ antiporter MnhB subunit
MKSPLRRLVILIVALGIVVLNVYLFEPDLGACLILAIGDAFLGLMLVAAWRKVRQDEIDRQKLEQARRERTWE